MLRLCSCALKTASTKDARAYDYYLRGREFFHRFRGSDMVYARQMFDQALEIDPDFALAWAGRADCYAFVEMYVKSAEKNRVEATISSKRALELDSAGAEPHASRGLAYLVCGQHDEAIEELETAIRINPRLFEPLYYYARASFHQGELQKAADLFEKASEVNPEDYQTRILRSHVLFGLGQNELADEVGREAIKVVERYLKWHPDDPRAFYLGAGTLQQLGERERAERWTGRALAIDPTDSVVLYNVACFYGLDGQVDKALNCLESAVDNGSVSASWMQNDNDLASIRDNPRFAVLIERLKKQGQRPAGPALGAFAFADLFEKASEVNPEDYQTRILRSHVLFGLGQNELADEVGREAIKVVERYLKWHPDDPRAFYLGAGTLQQLGERERAERWTGRALAIDPTDSVVLYNVACFYGLDGQVDKALNCLESAVDNGSVSASWMQNDNDLASIRDNPRFAVLIERLKKQGQQ